MVYLLFQVLSIFIVRSGYILFEPSESDFCYFLGTDNYSAFSVYPMLGVVLLHQCLKSRDGKIKKSGWLITLAIVISFLYVSSMTAAAAGVILILFLCIQSNTKRLSKVFNIKNVIVMFIVLFLLIQYGKIQFLFSNLLENVLKKGITLNSRTVIWQNAVELIKQNPIIGYGLFSEVQIKNYILYGIDHAHNIFLELLLRTGIIGTVGYLWFLVGFIKKNRKVIYKRPINIMLIVLLAQMILFFMDFYVTFQYFYCFMGILYYGYSFAEKDEVSLNGSTEGRYSNTELQEI